MEEMHKPSIKDIPQEMKVMVDQIRPSKININLLPKSFHLKPS